MIKFYRVFVTEFVFTSFFKVLKLLWISEGGKKSPFKNSGNSWGEGGHQRPLEHKILGGWGVQIKEYSVGQVWIFSGTTHSPSFCKTLWWRLTFTDFMPTTFKIDNKELKNTMEGECNPTGNNENSGIIRFQHSKKPKYHQPWKKVLYKKIKDSSIIPLQWAYTMKWGQVTFTWQDE